MEKRGLPDLWSELTLLETEEMKPSWFEIDKMPYDKMFPDDKYWMPYILDGKKINAYFEFDKDWNVVTKRIKEISKF